LNNRPGRHRNLLSFSGFEDSSLSVANLQQFLSVREKGISPSPQQQNVEVARRQSKRSMN